MNIAIDIDDTLTESFDYFQPFVAEFYGADVETLRKKNISYSTLPREWKSRELEFCRTCYDGRAADTPFKSDAAWGVNRLREMGHRIVIITGRTGEFYTDPYKTTRQELENGGISYDKLICTIDKGAACEAEGISLLIDDLPANCADAVSHGIPALLFDSKVNRNAQTLCRRVHNWAEAVEAVAQIHRGYPDRKEAQRLLEEAVPQNPGRWGDHARIAAACAEKIAACCGMDAEKAYVLGLLHDIGRRFRVRDLGHLYYGYRYMRMLGFPAVAKICLSHSFPNQDLSLYIGQIDIPAPEAEEAERLLVEMVFDDYDRLIQLCDALASADGVVDVEERMADVKRRYGRYPQPQWDKNLEYLQYFGEKTGKSVYEIVR